MTATWKTVTAMCCCLPTAFLLSCSVLQRVVACCSELQSVFERKSSAKSSFSSAQCKARVHIWCLPHASNAKRSHSHHTHHTLITRITLSSHASHSGACLTHHTLITRLTHRMQNLCKPVHKLCILHRFCMRCLMWTPWSMHSRVCTAKHEMYGFA